MTKERYFFYAIPSASLLKKKSSNFTSKFKWFCSYAIDFYCIEQKQCFLAYFGVFFLARRFPLYISSACMFVRVCEYTICDIQLIECRWFHVFIMKFQNLNSLFAKWRLAIRDALPSRWSFIHRALPTKWLTILKFYFVLLVFHRR